MAQDKDLQGFSKRRPFPLVEIIAERRFTLLETSGKRREITVRIGKPVPAHPEFAGSGEEVAPEFRCPLVITGIEMDGMVYGPLGGDALEAMQYTISLAGQIIDSAVARLNLRNPQTERWERANPGGKHFVYPAAMDWVWRYDLTPLGLYEEAALDAMHPDDGDAAEGEP